MTQLPTVGSIVHYYGLTNREPQAAMVAAISKRDPLSVSLAILSSYGEWYQYAEGAFNAGVPFSETPKSNHWSWPPLVNSGVPSEPEAPKDVLTTAEELDALPIGSIVRDGDSGSTSWPWFKDTNGGWCGPYTNVHGSAEKLVEWGHGPFTVLYRGGAE
jgi:hypothetical protein